MGLSVALSLCFWSSQPFVARYLLESPFLIWDGELWRFVTATFVHGDIIHLLFNLYWLRQFGSVVENWLGTLRFIGFFLLMALASSAAQFMFDQGGIGLSGVGYALFGLLFALRRDKDFAAAEMQPGVIQLFVGWFFLCIALTATGTWHVGNVAHGAGAVIGWLLGQAVLQRQRFALVTALTVVLLAFTASTLYMPWNGMWAWHRGIQELARGDQAAALVWFRQAAAAHPDNAELQQFVRQMEQAAKESGAVGP
jgi:membrane associated rhomboid family serine protease